MEPTEYANMASSHNNSSPEESAPLLDLEQQPNVARFSEDTNPLIDDPMASDSASSKESRHDSDRLTPVTTGLASAPPRAFDLEQASLPHPVGYSDRTQPPRFRNGAFAHFALLLPRIIAMIFWGCLFFSWMGMAVFYLICWATLQLATGFTRAESNKMMVRRDLGDFFNKLMDLFESIW